jgi:hypothetical protein
VSVKKLFAVLVLGYATLALYYRAREAAGLLTCDCHPSLNSVKFGSNEAGVALRARHSRVSDRLRRGVGDRVCIDAHRIESEDETGSQHIPTRIGPVKGSRMPNLVSSAVCSGSCPRTLRNVIRGEPIHGHLRARTSARMNRQRPTLFTSYTRSDLPRRHHGRPASRSSTSCLRTRGSLQPHHYRFASRTPDPPPSPSGSRSTFARSPSRPVKRASRATSRYATRDEGGVVFHEPDEPDPRVCCRVSPENCLSS